MKYHLEYNLKTELCFPRYNTKKRLTARKQRKKPLLSTFLEEEQMPIGIESNEHNNWINALMQFIIFIPGLRQIFDYTPQSFLAFNYFIEQYYEDRQAKKNITIAGSDDLLECLYRCFGAKILWKTHCPFNLYDILMLLMQQVKINVVEKRGNLLALHDEIAKYKLHHFYYSHNPR